MLADLASQGIRVLFGLLIIIFVLSLLACHIWFAMSVAPQVMARWTEEHGYTIVRCAMAGFADRKVLSPNSVQLAYRLIVTDHHNNQFVLLMKLGNGLWPSISAENCWVVVRWGEIEIDDDDDSEW